jgi:N-methylhydantoinase B
MRTAIAALPDGRYEAEQVLDGDGIHPGTHRVAVAVVVDGDRAVVDFTGTDPQVPASINSGLSQTTSAALFAFRCSLDPTIPMDEGCFAAVSVVAPEGSLVHVTPPHPGGGRFLANFAAVDAIFSAMADAHPEHAIAGSGILQPFALSGRRADGRPWIHTAFELGGMGARTGRDGVDAIGVHHGGGRSAVPQSEPLETQFPFLVETVELIPGSGGVGRWRGGLGTRTTFHLLTDAIVSMRCDRFDHPPAGRDGGGPGRPGGYLRVTPDGTTTRLPDKGANVPLAAGDRFVVETSGGGGLGDPAARDPAAIVRDRAEGRVTT